MNVHIFLYLITALFLALCLSLIMNKKWKQKKLILTANLLLPILMMIILLLRIHIGIEIIKGFVFFLILLYASNSDIKTREIENTIPVMIFITGLMGINATNIPVMICSSLLITVPILFIASARKDGLGGGDIKIIAGITFLLGLYKGVFAVVIGLSLAIVITLILKKKDKSFPLVPYLTVGSILAYLL